MKRRSFLTLIGAAVATPVLPAVAPAASYSRLTFGTAVLHARTRAHVSARGLSWCLKVPMAQAEAMMAEMATRGMITPIGMGRKMRAVSNILQPQAWHVAARAAPVQDARTRISCQFNSSQPLPAWLRHLRGIARANGHTMQTARVA